VDFVRQVKEAGFRCQMSSNGGLLTKAKGEALVEAGLDEILINAGDREEEYERVYKMPFQRTDENVTQFIKTAGDRCIVSLVLVDHHQDERHLFEMEYFWRKRGVKRFFTYGVINRGGALFVDHMQYEQMPQLTRALGIFESEGVTPRCGAPFGYLFIGYDANYYLCCSDWKKEAPMGTVFDGSFQDVIGAKLEHVTSRLPVCRTCNLDPVNILTEELAALDAGETTQEKVDEVLTGLLSSSTHVVEISRKLGVEPGDAPRKTRRLIPVWSE
jgi:MoaA/NifB/PqqE/SkfB family radical SAM enzyme